MRLSRIALTLIGTVCLMAGCKSPHVQVTVKNQTGADVKLLEVDYPSASFGVDTLGADSVYSYSIALTGEGPIKVQYTAPDKKQPQATGPTVNEGQAGKLEIVLLPGGKAEFHPELHSGK